MKVSSVGNSYTGLTERYLNNEESPLHFSRKQGLNENQNRFCSYIYRISSIPPKYLKLCLECFPCLPTWNKCTDLQRLSKY